MKKKPPEHVNLERWLVSYADFITLLFAFFVIMYATSQADMAKFKAVSKSLNEAFSSHSQVGIVELGGSGGGDSASLLDQSTAGIAPSSTAGSAAGGMNGALRQAKMISEQDPELQNLKEHLEESISLELGVSDPSHSIENLHLQFDSRGLLVRLAAKDFFAPGEAEVRPDFRPLLDRIGRVVGKTRRMIRIEGHSDPSEAQAQGFASDWELSAARAAWVVKYWIQRFGMDPKHLGIAAYSHYRPLASERGAVQGVSEHANASGAEWSRAKNRRVEIIILNSLYEVP